MKAMFGGYVALVLSAAAAHAAPIVANGNFATGDFTGWTVSGGGTTPGNGPRVVTLGGSDSTGYGDAVPTYMGSHAAFLVDDNADETLSQFITLTANTKYNLSFGLFATVSGARNPNSFTLTDTVSGLSQSFNSSAVEVGAWTTQNAFFTTADAGSYQLSFNFQAGDTAAKDVLLGGVSVSSVPLPASAPMFGAALLALAGFGYGMNRWVAPKGKKAAA